MANHDWPVSLIETQGATQEILSFIETYIKDLEEKVVEAQDLHRDYETLKITFSKQERYIAELEKQLILLQKTLDLIDKNRGVDNG